MRRQIAALLVILTVSPAMSEEPDGDVREGMSMIEQGMRMFFRGLTDEIEPHLDSMTDELEPLMRGLAAEFEPIFQQLAEMMDELDAYHAPERMPNGDIILRRKVPLVPEKDDGEVEL